MVDEKGSVLPLGSFLFPKIFQAFRMSIQPTKLILALLAPLAFLMGWPFPAGMALLEKRSANLMPWAWGINGFASVAAAPLAVLLAMSLGFRLVLALAVIAYLLAVLVALRLLRDGS